MGQSRANIDLIAKIQLNTNSKYAGVAAGFPENLDF